MMIAGDIRQSAAMPPAILHMGVIARGYVTSRARACDGRVDVDTAREKRRLCAGRTPCMRIWACAAYGSAAMKACTCEAYLARNENAMCVDMCVRGIWRRVNEIMRFRSISCTQCG